jgi:hypothetical protein
MEETKMIGNVDQQNPAQQEDRQQDPVTVKPAWYWIKDSKGYGSVTTTLVFVSFWVTTIAYVLSMFEKIGPVTIRPFDVGAAASYFAPVLTLYFSRKYSDAKFGINVGDMLKKP